LFIIFACDYNYTLIMAADGDEDFSKLSLEERIVHKNWKARFSAYEALQKQFSAAVDDKDPIFAKNSGYLKNFVTESNVFALEKGLDAFAAFLTTGTISVKVAGNICPSIVQKCLGSTKKKIVEKAQELLMLLIELEKQEAVLNALVEGTQNKNPKVISGSLATATAALQLFGAKVITVKSILKVALPLLEHRDKDVRENSKIFIVECYKWCGSAFKSQLESVKPILLNELEAEFSKFGNEVPLPTRYFRSQVQATVSNDVVACESSEPVATVVREEVDAWEFLDPVNVVAKLPSNFFDQLKSSKWLERKEILDMLATLIKANPRLDPSAQYGDIVSELKNAIGESDVEVRDAAAAAIGTLLKAVGESTLKPFITEIADDHLKMNKTIRQMDPKQVPVQAVVRFMAKKKEANFQILNLKFELYAYLATYCQFGPVAFRLCLAECLDKIADPKHNSYVSKVLSACAEALTIHHVADEVVRSAAIELVGILHWYIGSEIGMLFKSEKPAVLQMIETELKKSQSALNICQLIATSGGPTVREHVRIIVPGVIGLLSDSKPAIRQNALSVLNCWVEKTGIKELLTSEIIPNALTSDSPILRAELLAWLNGKLEMYQNKLPDADLKLTVPLVYSFVEDRNPEVRKQAQSILLPLTRVLGYDFMKNAASKLKPTSVNQIQTLLEKIRPNIIQRAVSPDNPEVEVCSESVKRVCGRGNPSVTSGRAKASAAQSKEAVKKAGNTEAVVTSSSCYLIDANSKQQRFQDEKNLKLLKWQFSIPSPDHVEQLKSQLSAVCKPELLQLLFNVDFKLQLKAVEMLNQSLEQNNELAFNCLDLILKWCTLRFFETNPSVLMRCLDLIQSLLQMCVDRGYKMHDLEVASFLPYLLMKLGDQKDAVRTVAQNLVGIIASLSLPCKIFPYLIESCKVKNSRQRAQCLMLMGSMISTEGLSICGSSPQVALKAIAAYIGDRDRYVRDAALNALVSAHLQAGGEKLFKFLSNLNSKDRSMLEERIKRSSRTSDDNNRTSEYCPVTATSTPLRSTQTPVSTISARNHGQPPEIERELDKIFPLDFKWNVEALGFDPDENISLCSLELIEQDVDCTPFVYEFKAHKYECKITDQSVHISAALDAAIRQIISSDLSSSTLALLQLREIVKDEMKQTLLHGRIDSLYTAIADQLGQLRDIYNNKMMKQDDQTLEDFYRSVITILLDIISVEELSKEISPEVQKNLLMQLLATLSFAGMNSLPESSNIQSSINLYGIKMMELYDPTKCVCALISLLRDTLRDGNNKADIRRCVLRCLWKWGRLLPTFVHKLDLSPVLMEIHDFFNEFSSSKCCSNNDESMAFKTMKTILHELGKQFGVERLLKQIDDEIENSANSEDVKILQKLKQCCKDSSSASDGSSSCKTHQSTDSAIEDVNAQVKCIIEKIRDATTFREGIVELHYFVEKNKNFNLQPYLKQFGIELRNHIQRCLDNLSKNPSTVANYCDTSLSAGEKSNWDANSSRGDFKKHVMKLNQLREKYGLSVLEVESNTVTTSPERLENSSSAFSADNSENNRKASESEKIESLKKRFEAIKKSLNIE
ncbi:Cytoskeleton-associated protein 5, partial [Trichinella zimbabwensis]